MAFTTHVGMNRAGRFGNIRLAGAEGVSLATASNTAATMPVEATEYIIRRITVSNPGNSAGGTVPSMAAANITIVTSSDGNTSNAVANAQTIGNITAAHTWQDLTLATATATTSYTAGALYVITNNTTANSTIKVDVYCDVVMI